MGSITEIKKVDPATGKTVMTYRAFIRRKGFASKSKVLETKSKAKEWLRNNEADTGLEKLTKGYGKTFKDIVDLFTEAPPTKGTKYWDAGHLQFWVAEFGLMKVTEISRSDINAAIATLQNKPVMKASNVIAEKKSVNATDKKITPATVNRYLASLSSVFNYALAHEIVDSHPMKGGKVTKLTEGITHLV